MEKFVDIETDRLLLRRWQETDIEPFIQMNKDPEVMRFFTDTLESGQTKQLYEDIVLEFLEYGYGLYAAEEKCSGRFIGLIGFHRADFEADFCPCIEIGWRLAKEYWGKGYATEGAKACLAHGFTRLGLDKIYSFTATANKPSQGVMKKIGMSLDQYFEHPKVPSGHPLRPHVCYFIENKQEYLK